MCQMNFQHAVCGEHPMAEGTHYVEMTLLEKGPGALVGVVGQDKRYMLMSLGSPAELLHDICTRHFHNGLRNWEWEGMPQAGEIKAGDVIGLLVVSGTMTLYVNGERAGEVCNGVHGKMCWAVMLLQPGESVQIARGATLPKDANHQQQQRPRTQSAGRPRTQQPQMRHSSPQRRPKRSPSRTPDVGECTTRLGAGTASGRKVH